MPKPNEAIELLKRLTIYFVEGEEHRVWINIMGRRIVGIDASSPEAGRLLQFDAHQRAVLAKAEGK